ncbi:MAG: hypothetical protein KAY24_20075 [Candidatus Eisenbacteria sp.]|nr:hypothetical protein [Candidatus Eisenbacteria bacterium]
MSTTPSKSFGTQRAQKAHLLRGSGGLQAEVQDVRNDTEDGFQALEARTGFPELDAVDGAGPSAAGGDMVLLGRALLQGQTFDKLVLWLTTSAVTITCLTPGKSRFTIQITDGATAGSEVVTKTGNAFVIQIEATVSTANQIATAINANAADSDGYLRATSGGADAVNAIAVVTAMAGGAGDFANNKIMAGGLECLPANTTGATGVAAWSNTAVTVTVPALTGLVATDKVQITLQSNGVRADAMSASALTGTPELDFHDVTGGAVASGGGDITLIGRALLQGQTFDELQRTEGAADLTVYALKPGASPLSVEITVGGGVLSAVIAANVLTIELQAAGDTDDAIATAINVSATCDGVVRATSAAGGSITLAQAEADLAGGVGDYANNKVMVGGLEALPQNETGTTTTAKWSDTSILATVPAVGGTGDHAQITVESNGVRTQALSAVLT